MRKTMTTMMMVMMMMMIMRMILMVMMMMVRHALNMSNCGSYGYLRTTHCYQ